MSGLFSKILIPVDLAELIVLKSALEKAVALANWCGADFRLVNVQNLLPLTFMDYVPADFDDLQKREASAQLINMESKIALPKERVSSCVRIGSIYSEILSEADEWGADLIVVGSHRPAMSTYLLGSNAKTIVRHAKCSVLVVRD